MRYQLYTCEEAQAHLQEALDARAQVLQAQKYAIESSRNSQRMIERSPLPSINADIARWEGICNSVCNLNNPMDIKQGLPIR